MQGSRGNNRRGFTLVEIMIVIGVIGMIVAIALPGYIHARSRSRAKACLESQLKLNWAVSEWALVENSDVLPSWVDLVGSGLYLNRTPVCPSTNQAVQMPPRLDSNSSCPTDETGHSLETDVVP